MIVMLCNFSESCIMGTMVHICRHLVHRTSVVSTFVQAKKYMYSNVASYPALASIPKFLPLSGGVIVSSCHDVYANLAFEDWLYENCAKYADCDQLDLMFLWRNHPCVVIGRHQNVWAECNVDDVLADGINIARRRSGGGTVYHDSGNLNITFITGRKNYNRKGNLAMIASMLQQQCSLDVQVSKRDDIMLQDKYKVIVIYVYHETLY
jgi:lipoate-protein ligase A